MKSNNNQNEETGYISFIFELLNVIFRLSLVNFKEKEFPFTLDKNFEEMFQNNKVLNFKNFFTFIFDLNEELNSIHLFLESDQSKKDFKREDINLDILYYITIM